MYKKKAIILSLIIALAITVWKKQEKEHLSLSTPASQWRQFKHEANGKISSRTPTPSEVKELKLMPHKKELMNAPSSPHSLERSVASTNKDKQIHFWDQNKPGNAEKKELNELNFINRYNKDWMQLLASDLLRFQDKETELFIYPDKSVVKILNNNDALFLEQVVVTFKTKNGPRSFQALINAETGKVIQTWGKTHYDQFQKRSPSSEIQTLTPNGTL